MSIWLFKRQGLAAVLGLVSLVPATMLSSAQVQAAEHIVEIRQLKFVPSQLKVRPGDTIKWINRDIAPHTATAMDRSWDTKLLKKDESFSITVTDKMKLNYFCRSHPHMKALLVLIPE